MSYTVEDIDEAIEEHNEDIEELLVKKKRLQAGEKPAKAYYYNHDDSYDINCSGCKARLWSVKEEINIPFEKDALCIKCNRTPEEKEADKLAEEAKRLRKESNRRDSELAQLQELRKKYPNE